MIVGCGTIDAEDRPETLQSADPLSADPNKLLKCDCFVRCSDKPPARCAMTEVKHLGIKDNCELAGRVHCTNHEYAYWKSACSRNGTEPAGCSCDPGPGGHCGKS